VLNGGIRWVALKEGRRRWMEEDRRGRGIQKRGLLEIWGRGSIFEIRDSISWLIFSSLEFGWTVTGVHQVAGSFGLGGYESSQNPGAKGPERLCS
jgi:hypothetical protein